jgi:integrase
MGIPAPLSGALDFSSYLEPLWNLYAMPKRVPPLSAKALAAVKPSNKAIELIDGYLPGLRVRILPSGKKAWSLNIRDSKGVRRRFYIGFGLSLAQARRRAEKVRQAVREGADPTTERKAARRRANAARDGHGTLAALIDAYFGKGPGAHRRRAAESKQVIQTVFAAVLKKPALDLKGAELQLIADHWRSATTASLAVRLIRPCLKWGEKRELIRAGIAAGLEQPAAARRRERVLSREELRAIWPHLKDSHGCVMKWLLWTGCRLNEAAGMRWGEIAAQTWTIPASRSKNGRRRVIPLPKQAIEMLRGQRPGEPQMLIFSSSRGGVLSNWDRHTKRLHALSQTSGWHRHDLRRTAATMLGDLSFLPHIISVVLGHAHIADGATAVYARSRYEREHREALQGLADEIDLIVAGRTNVVRLAV